MYKASANVTLPTSIIGSLPRPSWYMAVLGSQTFLEAMVNSRYREQYEDAVSAFLRAQEIAGLDIGEGLAREDRGLVPRLLPRGRSALNEPRTEHERLELLRREHELRHAVPAPHAKTHAGFALDRHAARFEIDDIAINRTSRDPQSLGELAAGQYAAASEQERQLKESIGPAHRVPRD
jgi:hypothetical protein